MKAKIISLDFQASQTITIIQHFCYSFGLHRKFLTDLHNLFIELNLVSHLYTFIILRFKVFCSYLQFRAFPHWILYGKIQQKLLT